MFDVIQNGIFDLCRGVVTGKQKQNNRKMPVSHKRGLKGSSNQQINESKSAD